MNFNDTEKNVTFECEGATDGDLEWFEDFSYCIGGVCQLVLGCIGFLANLLVLPVLLSKEMKNTFNHLLICLTIFDNVYVMCSILECIRKYFISTVEQMKLFVFVLYQLQSISFVCSVYQTVLLAVQRYLAISRPTEYYITQSVASAVGSDWKIALKSTVPVIVFSVIFNLPKFFEWDIEESTWSNPETNLTELKIRILPTDLRLNDDYVYYYVYWLRFLVTGLVPLVSLAFLNLAIYKAIRKRKQSIVSMIRRNPKIQTLGMCSTVEELVLFVIVISFFISTLPRIVLNIYEMVSIDVIRENLDNPCWQLPLWVLIITPTVYFLNCLNCSFNFVIYCIMYSAFRRELYSKANKLGLKMKKFWNNIKNPIINSISKDPSFQQPQRSKNLIEMDNITLKNDVV